MAAKTYVVKLPDDICEEVQADGVSECDGALHLIQHEGEDNHRDVTVAIYPQGQWKRAAVKGIVSGPLP